MMIHRHTPPVERRASTWTGGGTQSLASNRRPPRRRIRRLAHESMFNGDINEMNQAIAAGDYGGSFRAQDSAAAVRGQAHDAGCGWAWT